MTELQSARTHLRNADPVLARIIDERPDFDPWAWMAELPAMDLFGALLFQIVGQQLSVAATRRTLARIEALFEAAGFFPVDLGDLVTGGRMQQLGGPLAGHHLVRLPPSGP